MLLEIGSTLPKITSYSLYLENSSSQKLSTKQPASIKAINSKFECLMPVFLPEPLHLYCLFNNLTFLFFFIISLTILIVLSVENPSTFKFPLVVKFVLR